MVDTRDLKSLARLSVPVQVRPRAPLKMLKLVPSPSGKAAACKAAIPSSNLGGTSNLYLIVNCGSLAELVDSTGLENRRG